MKLLEASKIPAKIDTIRKNGVAFQNGVQLAAVSIVAHMAKSRDKTLIVSLYDAMPNGSRRKTMVDWLNHHVGFCMALSYKGSKLDVEIAPEKSPEWLKLNQTLDAIVETLDANPWHSYAPEKGEQDKLTLDAVINYLKRKSSAKDADTELQQQIAAIADFAEKLKNQQD
jgi:hypothetical protein